jgi:hypothetical protein
MFPLMEWQPYQAEEPNLATLVGPHDGPKELKLTEIQEIVQAPIS